MDASIRFFVDARAGSEDHAAKNGEVLSATQLYSGMERLKPQPHEEPFGNSEPWSDFLFVPKTGGTH